MGTKKISKNGKNKQKKDAVARWFREYKKNFSCSVCGENHPACIEFHHIRDKLFGISNGISRGYTKSKILKELEKCIPLCSNCHRKLHYNEHDIEDFEADLDNCDKKLNMHDE